MLIKNHWIQTTLFLFFVIVFSGCDPIISTEEKEQLLQTLEEMPAVNPGGTTSTSTSSSGTTDQASPTPSDTVAITSDGTVNSDDDLEMKMWLSSLSTQAQDLLSKTDLSVNAQITGFERSTINVNGGESLLVYGENFNTDAYYDMTIDEVMVSSIKVLSDEKLQITTPKALRKGLVDVLLSYKTKPISQITKGLEYVGDFPLKLLYVTPSKVDLARSETISLIGVGFNANMTLLVGGVGINYQLISDTQINFTLADDFSSSSDITLTRNGDQQVRTLNGALKFVEKAQPDPKIVGFDKKQIDVNGGETLTILGEHFDVNSSYSMTIDGVDASVTVVSSTIMRATTPAGAKRGFVSVVLLQDTSAVSIMTNALEYVGDFPLALSSVTPDAIDLSLEEKVSLIGNGFTADMTLIVGGIAIDYNYISETQIRFTLPKNFGSNGDISLTRSSDAQTVSLANALSFVIKSEPKITGFDKSQIDVDGNETLIIYGENFQPADKLAYMLTIDGMVASELNVISANQISVKTPKALRKGFVTLTLLKDTKPVSIMTDELEYVGDFPLVINAVSPTQVDLSINKSIIIIGDGFNEYMNLSVGGEWIEYTFITQNRISFKLLDNFLGSSGDIKLVRDDNSQASLLGSLSIIDSSLIVTSITPKQGYTQGGDYIIITGKGFTPTTIVEFAGLLSPNTLYISPNELRVQIPAHKAGKVALMVNDSNRTYDPLVESFEYIENPNAVGYNEAPYVVGAKALSSTEVLVQFSEPMAVDINDTDNFSISSVEGQSKLKITAAVFRNGDTSEMLLSTYNMSQIGYRLAVVGVTDIDGNAPLSSSIYGTTYNTATFQGKGEIVGADNNATDTDGDGLSDADEQRGFSLTITMTSGEKISMAVSSNPDTNDTDGDRLSDYYEFSHGTNPHSADSDGDQISDYDEVNIVGTDPLHQDSDGDGLNDLTELEHPTSASLADTDGDQFSDYEEMIEMGTNPNVANLPKPNIYVSGISAAIDVRFTETRTDGTSSSTDRSFTSSIGNDVTQSISSSIGFGFNGHFNKETGTETDKGVPVKHTSIFKLDYGIDVSSNFEHSWGSDHTTSVAFEESQSSNYTTEFTKEISREVVGGRITVAVSFETKNPVAFTLRDIELSLLIRDPEDPDNMKPIATLSPVNDDLEINMGPLSGEKGPILFHASEPIPADVEDLIKNASLYTVKIANYNLTDENGRNFAYASQDVYNRTAGFSVVFNDGLTPIEYYRLATMGNYDPVTLKPIGVSLEEALKSLQLYQVDDAGKSIADMEIVTHSHPNGEGGTVSGVWYIANTFSVTNSEITRYKHQQIAYKGGVPEGYDYWVLLDEFGNKIDATSLSTTYLESKGNYTLIYTRDLDGDGLSEAEEKIIGTKDVYCDSDADGLSDYREFKGLAIPYKTTATEHPRAKLTLCPNDVNQSILSDINKYAWRIAVYNSFDPISKMTEARLGYYRAYSSPLLSDSDSDGIDDIDEFKLQMDSNTTGEDVAIWQLDPLLRDTDDDGLKDKEEIEGYKYISIDDDSDKDVTSYNSRGDNKAPFPNVKDSDKDTIIDGLEKVFGTNPAIDDSNKVIDHNRDGLPDYFVKKDYNETSNSGVFKTYGGNYTYAMNESHYKQLLGTSTTTVDSGDVDGDGLPNVWEFFLGTNPFSDDTDGDGLKDNEEWDYTAKAKLVPNDVVVISPEDYARAEAACEYAINCTQPVLDENANNYNADPCKKDTDGDGLDDKKEVVGWDVWLYTKQNGTRVAPYHVSSNPRIQDKDLDGFSDLNEYNTKTDPNKKDTDGDGVSDYMDTFNDRSPLKKDVRYRFKISLISIQENGTKMAANETFFNINNYSAMFFSEISLMKGDGDLIKDTKTVINPRQIAWVMNNQPIQTASTPASSRTPIHCMNYDDTNPYFYSSIWMDNTSVPKVPVLDGETFVFDETSVIDYPVITIAEEEKHYLSFKLNFLTNAYVNVVEMVKSTSTYPCYYYYPGTAIPYYQFEVADKIVQVDGILNTKLEISTDELINNGFVTLKVSEQDSNVLSAAGFTGGEDPEVTIVFTAERIDESNNTTAVFAGDFNGTVNLDNNDANTTGKVTVTDPDSGESAIVEQNSTAGTYGKFSIDKNGNWNYTLTKTDSIEINSIYNDSFEIETKSGDRNNIVITISGKTMVINIAGTLKGDINSTITNVSGDVNATDSDGNSIDIKTDVISGQYGYFSITDKGNWSYYLTNIDHVPVNDTVIEKFYITSVKGGKAQVDINITGKAQSAIFSGDQLVILYIHTGLTIIKGKVNVTKANVQVDLKPASITGTYGNFVMNDSGDWTYTYTGTPLAVAYGTTGGETFIIETDDGDTDRVLIQVSNNGLPLPWW